MDHRAWAAGIDLMVEDNHLIVADITVHPTRTDLGIGRGFMARADAKRRIPGLHEQRLSTAVKIPKNAALYMHLGWEEMGRTGNKVLMRMLL